ncbi:aminotransferase class I/II-fold pyridoxal phosphate-dependent enzyme [Algoriphagus confluentis]|uniref:Aminotransferase n=1 Tax=Algoriphagus confluentis TaxID=1697556 RepID=A0ABQ6PTR7_9BACT|nr:LL-diaminopimelate aminotransferase [Algoriphagus confluentis]
MPDASFLSQKGSKAAQNPIRVDLKIYSEAMENLYHPQTNPSGTLPMNIAENQLCWEILRERIQKVTREKDIPDWVANYTDSNGAPSFRKATAGFLSKFLFHCPVDPDSLALSVGATSVIEMTSFLLANPGDTAVIPAPSYPVYTGDIGNLPGVLRYDLQLPGEFNESEYDFEISLLDQARAEIEDKGSQFRLLILTSPDNPTGKIYREDHLRAIAQWCIKNQTHLIVNEIYALSQIDIRHPELKSDYPNPAPFVSFGKLMQEFQSPFLHFWYSFSKDFGISGFRIGLLHSHNTALIQGYQNAGAGHCISNYTQWVMQEVLDDSAFLASFFKEFQTLLTQAYLSFTKGLRNLHIPFNPSRGSLFVWMDLSEFLEEKSYAGEEKLWLDIFNTTSLLLTPPQGFGHQQRGWYRAVITSLRPNEMEVALKRLETFVEKRRKERI